MNESVVEDAALAWLESLGWLPMHGRRVRPTQDRKKPPSHQPTAGSVAALKAHRKRQLEERLRLTSLWQDHDLVFPSTVGTPLNHRNLSRAFKDLVRRAELPESTCLYNLRHTCATLLLSRNVHPKYVQKLLGHASITLTLDTYSHVLPGMEGAAASAMKEALGT